jgi:hypothetical protein
MFVNMRRVEIRVGVFILSRCVELGFSCVEPRIYCKSVHGAPLSVWCQPQTIVHRITVERTKFTNLEFLNF